MQLEAIKKERGPSVEDGSVVRDKTLAAILAENKAKKEEQFADVWKTMKQGRQSSIPSQHLFALVLLTSLRSQHMSIFLTHVVTAWNTFMAGCMWLGATQRIIHKKHTEESAWYALSHILA